MESYEIKDMIKDPKEFLGAVYGTLLGDSSLSKPKTFGGEGNSRFSFGQNNKEYAQYKSEIFNLGKPILYGTTWRAQSERLPLFTKLYAHLYPDNRKTVTEHVMKVISELGLSLLYMDDGDLHKEKHEVKILSMGFNECENNLLSSGLYKKFNLRFNVRRRKSGGGNRKEFYFYLYLKKIDTFDFFQIIKKYVPSCMSYKIPTTERMQLLSTTQRLPEELDKILTPAVLIKMRYLDNMSYYQMANELGVNSGTILGRMRKVEAKFKAFLHQEIV